MTEEKLRKVDPKESTIKDSESTASETIEIPDGGYGWVIALCFFLYNFCTWGANSGYAIYLADYLSTNAFPGGGKLDYAAVGGIAFGGGLLFAPVIVHFSRIYGVQIVIGIGIVCQTAALLLAAFSKKLWQLYLTQGLLISFGLASICIPSFTLVPQWFRNKRTLASGIGTSGSGLGGIIFNLGMQRIIEVKSVKWALIVQCIICSVLSCIALALTRTRTKIIHGNAAKAKSSFKELAVEHLEVFKIFGMWLLCLWVAFTMLGYVIILYSLSAFTQSLGYNAKKGSYVSCMVSLGGLVGRPIIGHIADKFGPITVGAIVNLIVAILCWAMWIPCTNFGVAIAFGLLQGALIGTVWVIFASVSARVIGLKRLEKASGVLWVFIALFAIPAPVIGLQLDTDVIGSKTNYVHTAIFTGFAYFGAALLLYLLRIYIITRDEKSRQHSDDHDNFDRDETSYTVDIRSFAKNIFSGNIGGRKV
ncbi:probable transporter MCH2 [Kluyveromyces marxianus]|nr:probable transporter MCH2 [Kluyveromyces marxianus]